MKTNFGNDQQALQMNGGAGGGAGFSSAGTASAATATSATTNQTYTSGTLIGKLLVMGGGFGVIVANPGGANTVLTIDKWYDPAAPGGAALATPTAGAYMILGGAPAVWMGITTDATAPAATDTSLATELTLSGLTRKMGTIAHSVGVASWSLAAQFTNPDTTSRTINKQGEYCSLTGNTLCFESAVPSPPPLASSTDSVTITTTITE